MIKIKPVEKWGDIDELLNRGVDRIYPNKEALEKVLRTGKKLKLYQGFDPTGSELHIGHAVGIMKMRQFQDLGHEIIFLIGDGTGQAGDPSGKTSARDKFMTNEELRNNARDYVSQAGKIVNFKGKNPVKILYNGDWLNKLTLTNILNIINQFSLQQLLERDIFQNRMKDKKTVNLREFVYPALQAYDSVAMDVDLELGGTDQTFNMLAGRTLMKAMSNKEKFVMTVPLLADATGRKIGKTEGNVIAITGKPEQLFGQIMNLPDSAIVQCFELITNVSMAKVSEIENQLKSNKTNPMQLKKKLAWTLVKQYNDEKSANKAQENFEKKYQSGAGQGRGEASEKIHISKSTNLIELIVKHTKTKSRAEAKRLINQGGVKINGKKIDDISLIYQPKKDDIIEIGKHVVYKVH
jgi:tyrosyl-tRNA synthetase